MKNKYLMGIIPAFLLCFTLHAVQINVMDIQLTPFFDLPLPGDFTYAVTPESDFSFTLSNPGEMATVKYGTFFTDDFPIGPLEQLDIDLFVASFDVQPPVVPQSVTNIGSANANFVFGPGDTVNVTFLNFSTQVAFGSGGLYEVMFLDTANLTADGTLDLEAKFTLISDSAAIPEPSTYALMGLGLSAMAAYKRKKRS